MTTYRSMPSCPAGGDVSRANAAEIADHRQVQQIAKAALAQLDRDIEPIDTEQSIVAKATRLMEERGVTETWYYQCPALVLLGSRSCLSISGKQYEPSNELAGTHNLVCLSFGPMVD